MHISFFFLKFQDSENEEQILKWRRRGEMIKNDAGGSNVSTHEALSEAFPFLGFDTQLR